MPAQVVARRGQEEVEVEVRAGEEGGLFVVKAMAEPAAQGPLPAECRVQVDEPGLPGRP